jgi:DNA/RNA-binding domain of Phe-tRNA-synthetase-like protein
VSAEPALHEGEVDPALAEEWPGLRLAWSAFEGVPGRSPLELRERLRLLSDRFRGPQAIVLRRQPIPHAYRVFFRHIGLEPDEHRVPVEALALERMKKGGFQTRSLLDDAITIAVMETHVPVWALDGAAVEGALRLRAAVEGEPLGRGAPDSRGAPEAPPLPAGRLVVADDSAVLAVLFGDPAPGHGVTPRTREIVLFSVAVPGVPPIHVEEALWTVWDIVAG